VSSERAACNFWGSDQYAHTQLNNLKIKELLVSICLFTALERLTLLNLHELTRLPPSIGTLTMLTTLEILVCALTELSGSIETLTALGALQLNFEPDLLGPPSLYEDPGSSCESESCELESDLDTSSDVCATSAHVKKHTERRTYVGKGGGGVDRYWGLRKWVQ